MSLSQTEKDYNKCLRKIDSLIAKAVDERNKKGYRENLGYDSLNKLQEFIDKFDSINYHGKCHLERIFFSKCNSI